MGIIQSLFNLLSKSESSEMTEDMLEGACPNCWGREMYGGKFFEAVKKETHGLDEKGKRGWVQDYADKHLNPITLNEKGDCPSCTVDYKEI